MLKQLRLVGVGSPCTPKAVTVLPFKDARLKKPFLKLSYQGLPRGRAMVGRAATLEEVLRLAQEIDAGATTTDGEHWDGGGFEDEEDGPGMTTSEVRTLLKAVCGEPDVSEMEIKSGNFELRVLRTSGTAGVGAPSMRQLGFAYPVGANHVSMASASMDDLPPIYSTMTSEATASMASMEDDGSSIPTRRLLSKEVGFFYSSRTSKKRPASKPTVEEGDIIKAGQVVGFLERVGHLNPIKAEENGEVVAFLVENGQTVQYGQAILEFRPQ